MGVSSGVVEAVVPRRLGVPFRWLLASSWTTNLGDGIALAAGPLLVASRTDSEFLVALAALVQWTPPLVFGLWAGALTDRWDRRRIMMSANAVRSAVLVVLAVAIAGGVASIAVVLGALFVLGVAEVFTDNAASAVLPSIVARADLAVANARLTAGFVTINQLAGAPLGALLFAAGASTPFATQAGLVLVGFALLSRLRLPERAGPTPQTHLRHDIAEGFRWVVHHAAVRTLVLTILIFNVTFGAAWSVLVLYATERLGLGEVGFGLITTVSALGGLLGTLAYGSITRFVSLGNLMRIGLVIETLTHLALALTTSPPVAMAIFFLFGAHAFIWHTTSVTVRQRAVPARLQGRVGSVNLVGVYGGLVAGSALGGLLAQGYGVTAPFWFAFGGSAVFVVLIWGQLAHIAHADEAEAPVTG
ncbi:MFS transporter [Nocardioides marinquilinus]|uniref:MFS transporter n=1 Tax=Nocardioides marinquilinus TaxID=1210400 RepID=UPI0031F13E16